MRLAGLAVCLVQLTDFPEAGRIDIYEYSKALAEQGVKTHVIICRRLLSERFSDSLVVHELDLPTSNDPINVIRFVIRSFARIRELQREQRIKLVHLFNPAPATFLLTIMLRLSLSRPRLIYDVRTGGLGRGLDALAINIMAKLAPLFADGVIVLSRPLAYRLYRGSRIKMAIVPLGVDTKAFRPTKRPMRKSISFIYVGTLNKNRRLQSMLEAFEMVYQDYPDVRLLIAGAGNDRMNLEAWTRKRRLQEAIKFLDRIDHREVPGLVQQADCGLAYVPITPWFQPQPQLKTLEYLAAGLPVVATATAGNAALWNSLPKPLLTSDEPQEFAAGLRYAVENISELAKINFRKVALRYEWSTVVRRNLLPFYQEVFKGQ